MEIFFAKHNGALWKEYKVNCDSQTQVHTLAGVYVSSIEHVRVSVVLEKYCISV